MKLKSVHLFAILFLSLLIGSLLGKLLSSSKEGNEPMNKHTGGEQDDVSELPETTGDAVAGEDAAPPSAGPAETNGNGAPEPEYEPESSESTTEPFSSLFDSILPSNVGKLEPFMFPSLEGLTNGSDASKGITKDQIPPGQEHLYILKSQVVPPSCPVNPGFNNRNGKQSEEHEENEDDSEEAAISNLDQDGSSGLSNGLGAAFNGSGGSKNKKCPPCPACARCPEPSFECKKVPNYSVSANGSMSVPRPVLADFTQFGM